MNSQRASRNLGCANVRCPSHIQPVQPTTKAGHTWLHHNRTDGCDSHHHHTGCVGSTQLSATHRTMACTRSDRRPSVHPLLRTLRSHQARWKDRPQKIASGNGCTAADANTQWGCGWTVFIDANNNATQDSGELTLQTSSAPTKLEINLASSNGYITVDRWGQLASAGSSSFNFRLFPKAQMPPTRPLQRFAWQQEE